MVPIYKILARCIVVEFYKQNAAFFGLIFLVLFGFIKSNEHIAIGSFLVANPATLFFLYVVWAGYCIKVVLFVIPAINKRENQFLESFALFPTKTKISSITLVSAALLLPIIAYSEFLIVLALTNGFLLSLGSLLLFSILFIVVVSILLFKKLISLPHEKSFIQIRFLNKVAKPSFLFFIEHLMRNDFVLLLLSKAYSCLLIIGAAALYRTDQFDIRLITTGVLLAMVGNVAILHKYIWFYFHKTSFTKNLPWSILKISSLQFLTFLIIIIPEIIVIVRHFPITPSFIDVTGIISFSFSIIAMIYALMLLKQVELSDFVIQIFWLVVLSTFLILFSIHPLILAILYVFISIVIIHIRYFKFEFIEKAQ